MGKLHAKLKAALRPAGGHLAWEYDRLDHYFGRAAKGELVIMTCIPEL
jgi:hypothetical protein